MSEVSWHERIARWAESGPKSYSPTDPFRNLFVFDRLGASDLLDEWEDAQAMILALRALVEQLSAPTEAPPAWTVIA